MTEDFTKAFMDEVGHPYCFSIIERGSLGNQYNYRLDVDPDIYVIFFMKRIVCACNDDIRNFSINDPDTSVDAIRGCLKEQSQIQI